MLAILPYTMTLSSYLMFTQPHFYSQMKI